MKKIALTRGLFTIVDDEDYEKLSRFKWYASTNKRTYYAVRNLVREGKWTTILMHRQILNAKPGEEGDHRDHNGLNNTRGNLRTCSRSQNLGNQRPRKGGSSKYKGVSWDKRRKKWRAYIMFNNKHKHLGRFDNETEAARAYDQKAKELFGEFANVNIFSRGLSYE